MRGDLIRFTADSRMAPTSEIDDAARPETRATRRRIAIVAAGVVTVAAVGPWSAVIGRTSSSPVVARAAVRFVDYAPPSGYGNNNYWYAGIDGNSNPLGGEPSVGIDRSTGAVMYMALAQVSRITFDDSRHPATASWTDVTPPLLNGFNEDPVLFTDPTTGRTVAAGLEEACSAMAFTDDDGSSWDASQGCPPVSGIDHPTVGGGPYAPPVPVTNLGRYRDSVFYCAQTADRQVGAVCGRSDDGGQTFLPANESTVFGETSPCGAIHGHVRVTPDGTVMVPNHSCHPSPWVQDELGSPSTFHQGVALSHDNGATWSYSLVPDSTSIPLESDPSVAAGSGGTIYLGYEDGTDHPRVAVSMDRGVTWRPSVDVGAPLGIRHSKFPEVIAGDDDRAAFAWLGTTSDGDDQSASFHGTWYLFVSYTYDRGETWSTVAATPDDPVQRGCISMLGGTAASSCRNLLDFNDITVDAQGRVVVAYTDGCANVNRVVRTGNGLGGPSHCDRDPTAFADSDKVAVPSVARQSCGRTLFARYDRQALSCTTATSPTAHLGRSVMLPSAQPPTTHRSGRGPIRCWRRRRSAASRARRTAPGGCA